MSVLGNKNDSIHQFILDEEYARLRAKQKISEPFCRVEDQPTTNLQKPQSVILKELSEEEAKLISEKDQLIRTREVLNHRITELIENKRSHIQQLRAEILGLRQECETFVATMEISTQCSDIVL